MDLLATSTSLLLVNLLFAGIALAVGFAAGAWFFGGAVPSEANDEDKELLLKRQRESNQLDRERTTLVSDRLRDMALSVATDVGAHNASIERIEAELAASRGQNGEVLVEAVARAVDDISQANAELQERLAKAERQIEAQAKEIRVHESEARTDSLTQLANRRAFDDELKRRIAEWRRHKTPVSLLILDVDHFKRFNDTHGHQAGDEVLRKVGEVLTLCARDMDLPCRYGGEEFAIVLPATVGSDGGIVAERVRKAVEGLAIDFEGKALSVTVSVGLAEAGPEEEPAELIRRADEALYRSKDAGRNNGHLHDNKTCVPITPVPAPENPKQAKPNDADSLASGEAVANRTRFLEELRQRVREAEQRDEPLALLGAELQGYRRLRSEFGEEIAQLTLDSVGQFIENALRDVDFIGRLGEGRFVVLMPGSDSSESEDFGDRVRDALAGCSVPLGDENLQLNTRMTTAEFQRDDTEVTLMLRIETAMDALDIENGETAVV